MVLNDNFDNGDVEIIDADSGYREDNDANFSHQALVMTAMRNCIDAGAKEMRSGWFNTTVNNRGETKIIYIDDTRKTFVENVKNALMVMACDYDEEFNKKLNAILTELSQVKKDLLEQEEFDWTHSSRIVEKQRWSRGVFFRKGYFATELPYYQDYMEEEVNAYRKIYAELSLLTKRLDFFKEIMYVN